MQSGCKCKAGADDDDTCSCVLVPSKGLHVCCLHSTNAPCQKNIMSTRLFTTSQHAPAVMYKLGCLFCRLHLDEQILAEKKQGLATSSLDPAAMSMEAADEALFTPDDIVHSAFPNAGGVLAASRDRNTMLVQQDKAADTHDIEDGPEPNLDSFEFEMNEFKANAYLTAADPQESNITDAKANESADLAAMQAPAQNNIVPFLLARIAQALE